MSKLGSRTIARLIVLVILLAGLILAIFLATVDLNRYRDQISSTLSSLFNRPVSFTRIGFSMAHGLAVDCQKLVVSSGQSDAHSLTADHLYLKVSLLPLLEGDLVLREVILARPQLLLDLTAEQEAPELQTDNQSGLIAKLGELHIHQGTVDIRLPAAEDRPNHIKLEDLDLRLQRRPKKRLGVEVSSHLAIGKQETDISLKGEIYRAIWPNWHKNNVELEFFGRNLPLTELLKLAGIKQLHVSGNTDLSLSIKGAATTGLVIGADLSGDQASYSYQGSAPLPLGRSALQGIWQHPESGEDHFNQLTLDHDDIHLAGNLTLKNETLHGDLNLHQTLFSNLLRLAPDSLYPESFKARLPQGRLSLTADIAPVNLDELKFTNLLQRTTLEARLQDFTWKPPGLPMIEQGKGHINLAGGELRIPRLQALWQARPQTLSGTIDLNETQPHYNLLAKLDPPLTETAQLLSERAGQQISLAGSAALELRIKGSQSRPSISIFSDLDKLYGSFGGWYEKPLEVPGEIALKLDLNRDGWEITDSHLQIDGQKIEFTGFAQPEGTFTLGLKTSGLRLDPIGQQSRLLAKHKPRGMIDLDLTFARSTAQPTTVNGRISLNNVGIHLTPLLADINRANGTILFHGEGLETVLINAHLGDSPVTLQAALPDFSDPALKLRLIGKTVRADELIFHSHLLYLRDLDGRLTIDRHGIGFDQVDVRLDGGTACQVRGAMQGWKDIHVALEIDASYGNIDEVINLWHDPAPGSPKATKTSGDKPGTTVSIDVRAEKGHINRLQFERATATVSTNGRGLLSVFPLQFHTGEGHGTGQVLADSSKGPTSLTISGHLENFPASSIHKELLQRDSLVTGTLRGDFHLQGLAGEGFKETSNGGISVEIEKGVLKKFQFLSKVFSLLNISQILTFQLPDMAEEGMPFITTTGTFSLTQGLLRTEDLLVNSEAMDLSLVADYDILSNRINGTLGVKPLKTVDKIITKIPIAGWLLTGDDKALVTALFTIKGDADDPEVDAVPVTSLSSKVFGIFKRVLTLPGEVITDPGKVILPQSANPKE